MFHLVQFLKCWQLFLELNSKRVNRSSRKEKESFCLVFTYSTEKCTKNHDARAVIVFCPSNLLLFWRSRCRRLRLSIVNKASCKRTQHCWMLHVVSDVGRCCTVCTPLQYGRNNTQHCWRNNVGSCCISLHVAKAVGKIMLYLLGSSWLLWEI